MKYQGKEGDRDEEKRKRQRLRCHPEQFRHNKHMASFTPASHLHRSSPPSHISHLARPIARNHQDKSVSLKRAFLHPHPLPIFDSLMGRVFMRFAIDTVDETGNNRIYIGTPLGMAEDKLCVQLRDREMKIQIDKIVDWFQIDLPESRERGQLFQR
nr:hypothetical protein [uncultured Rhizobium sp.]